MSSKIRIFLVLFLVSVFSGIFVGKSHPEYVAYALSLSESVTTGSAPSITGVASWYGIPFHGRTMANGERYNMHDPHIVAHKSLPFGTMLYFVNPENGKTLVATVSDRGPFIEGRTFDLSLAGAKNLGFRDKGITSLVGWIIKRPK